MADKVILKAASKKVAVRLKTQFAVEKMVFLQEVFRASSQAKDVYSHFSGIPLYFSNPTKS
jgi:hypothetical protein